MKKLIFTTLLCAVAGAASSQVALTFGVKAGANFAKLSSNEDADARFRPGLHAGFFANVAFTDKLSFQPELFYSAQGTKLANNLDNSDEENRRMLVNYVQVPLLLQYALTEKLSVQAGPQIGILLSAKRKWDGYWEEDGWDEEYTYIEEPDSDDIKEYFKTLDIGLGIGLGYKISERFGIYTRYIHGLTNMVKEQYLSPGEKEGNRVIAVGLSYSF